MENNEQPLEEFIPALNQAFSVALNNGVPISSLLHAINGLLANFEGFHLDDDSSAEFASHNHMAWGLDQLIILNQLILFFNPVLLGIFLCIRLDRNRGSWPVVFSIPQPSDMKHRF
jgi:hypothetical protein